MHGHATALLFNDQYARMLNYTMHTLYVQGLNIKNVQLYQFTIGLACHSAITYNCGRKCEITSWTQIYTTLAHLLLNASRLLQQPETPTLRKLQYNAKNERDRAC